VAQLLGLTQFGVIPRHPQHPQSHLRAMSWSSQITAVNSLLDEFEVKSELTPAKKKGKEAVEVRRSVTSAARSTCQHNAESHQTSTCLTTH
jgi:hypothetical protein